MNRKIFLLVIGLFMLMVLAGCGCHPGDVCDTGAKAPEALATATPTVTSAPSNTPSATPSSTPAPATDTPAAPTATATATAGPGQAQGACANRYFPTIKGATWTYTLAGLLQSSRTSVVTDVVSGGFTLQSQRTQPAASDSVHWVCTSDGLATILQASQPDAIVDVDPGAGVTLPAKVQAGDMWTQVRSGSVKSKSASGTVTITYQFRAMNVGPQIVPAGTFQALRVYGNATATLPGGKSLAFKSTYWYAPGVGLIELETVPATGVFHWDLASYKIP
jgi:hypothetical protein